MLIHLSKIETNQIAPILLFTVDLEIGAIDFKVSQSFISGFVMISHVYFVIANSFFDEWLTRSCDLFIDHLIANAVIKLLIATYQITH